MASSSLLPLLLLLLLLFLSAPASLCSNTTTAPSLQLECNTGKSPDRRTTSSPGSSFVPSASLLSTLKSALDEINKVMSLVSTFSGSLGGNRRLSSAVSDCLDLLDLSSDEVTWALSSSQPAVASAGPGTGNRRADLRSWMSAALGNQDTCKEGLAGTGGLVETLVSGGLDMVTSLVSDGLREIRGGGKKGAGRRRLMGFPEWVSAGDRRLLQAQPAAVTANAVVAQDGTGNYTTVSAAVAAAPTESAARYVIYVKKGVYKENVEIKKKMWNLMLVGDGMGQTIISGSRSFVDGWTTFRSATFAVAGKGFIARDLTVENTAGPQKHQAVALRSDSDLSVFYRCEFSGYQDTLYAHSLRQFYRECRISGTVDFIFGDAAAVFQSCRIIARRPLPDQKNTVTAQGRKDPNQNTGFSFQFCNVTGDADLTNSTATYLGRPWKEYSVTVFMQSYLEAVIRPEGWLEWNGDFALKTLYYGEYMNYGPGSGLGARVTWPGYHAISDTATAANFTVAQFIDGNMWLPSTGVKYTAGLTV
ncbi:pectinesterase [Canna indica]|uniref:Pectinesterase n=1 Tax=Canna indica TaxID=4628 RepID=A0AAQ3Q0Q2_9LILI|nr:pectinesterase [Canna indica]